MCGINGFNFSDEKLITAMNLAIKHRGPDGEGIFLEKNLSLGQVRLSIIDLSDAGHQPMFYSKNLGASNEKFNSKHIVSSDYSIVFNGEIYNYIEIKSELEKKGYKFTTHSDTEVILAAYDMWGEKCVNKFNGMWAFAIYDKKKEIIFCSRDRLGVKPFYYYLKNGTFIFSSELKGILEHKELKINRRDNINKQAVELYFQMGYIPSPHTIFNDVYKLSGSKNLIFDLKSKKIKEYRYYEIPSFNPINNKKKLLLEGKELLQSAVKLRMRSDVAVGAFLSGGLDSSSVVSEMKNLTHASKLHTFSIGFTGKKYDETPYINLVKNKFKTVHHHYYFKEKDFDDLLEAYKESYDEPFGDYSGFPTHKVSELARKNVIVSLSGDGGDEIFGGYITHQMGYRMDFLYKLPKVIRLIASKVPVRKNLNSPTSLYFLREAFKISLKPKEDFFINALSSDEIKTKAYKELTKKRLKYCLNKSNNSLGDAIRIYDLIYNTLQDYYLVKVDRASMRYGLEVRSPFLDYRFVEYSQKIPTNLKTNMFNTKVLMREIIRDMVPKEILTRGKQGFGPPLKEWLFKKHTPEDFVEYLKIIEGFNDEIHDFYKDKVLKNENERYFVYKIRLYLFAIWYEHWIKE